MNSPIDTSRGNADVPIRNARKPVANSARIRVRLDLRDDRRAPRLAALAKCGEFALDSSGDPTDEEARIVPNTATAGDKCPMAVVEWVRIARLVGTEDLKAHQDLFLAAVHRTLVQIYRATEKAVPPEVLR